MSDSLPKDKDVPVLITEFHFGEVAGNARGVNATRQSYDANEIATLCS